MNPSASHMLQAAATAKTTATKAPRARRPDTHSPRAHKARKKGGDPLDLGGPSGGAAGGGGGQISIVCLVESRARETCIAQMDLHGNQLSVYTTADNPTYTDTLEILASLSPDEVLLHQSACSSKHKTMLTRKVEKMRDANRGGAWTVFGLCRLRRPPLLRACHAVSALPLHRPARPRLRRRTPHRRSGGISTPPLDRPACPHRGHHLHPWTQCPRSALSRAHTSTRTAARSTSGA